MGRSGSQVFFPPTLPWRLGLRLVLLDRFGVDVADLSACRALLSGDDGFAADRDDGNVFFCAAAAAVEEEVETSLEDENDLLLSVLDIFFCCCCSCEWTPLIGCGVVTSIMKPKFAEVADKPCACICSHFLRRAVAVVRLRSGSE